MSVFTNFIVFGKYNKALLNVLSLNCYFQLIVNFETDCLIAEKYVFILALRIFHAYQLHSPSVKSNCCKLCKMKPCIFMLKISNTPEKRKKKRHGPDGAICFPSTLMQTVYKEACFWIHGTFMHVTSAMKTNALPYQRGWLLHLLLSAALMVFFFFSTSSPWSVSLKARWKHGLI